MLEQMPVLEVKGLNTEWSECFVPAQRTKTRLHEQPSQPECRAVGLPLSTIQETAFIKQNRKTEKLLKRNRQPKYYRQQN